VSSLPQVLLVHDGELGDVREVLENLGVAFFERDGSPEAEDHQTQWAVVVGSPRRVLEPVRRTHERETEPEGAPHRTSIELLYHAPVSEELPEAYEATLDIYEYNGLLKERYAYDQICAAPPGAA